MPKRKSGFEMQQSNDIPIDDEKGYFEVENFNILEKPEAASAGVPLYIAHWKIFVPTVVIAMVYMLTLIALYITGLADSGFARICMIVVAIVVPFSCAFAFLRYQTIRVQINEHDILCHMGWPKDLPIDVPISGIANVDVHRRLTGRLFGGGTLVLKLVSGSTVSISDLRNVRDAKKEIEAAMKRDKEKTSS